MDTKKLVHTHAQILPGCYHLSTPDRGGNSQAEPVHASEIS